MTPALSASTSRAWSQRLLCMGSPCGHTPQGPHGPGSSWEAATPRFCSPVQSKEVIPSPACYLQSQPFIPFLPPRPAGSLCESVSLGCYNKDYGLGGVSDSHLFLTVSELGTLYQGACRFGSWWGLFPACRCHLLTWSHAAFPQQCPWGELFLFPSLPPLMKALTPTQGPHPHDQM